MTPKSHHYNPQVYLRQFVNPARSKELWEFDVSSGSAKPSSPKQSGCEDYYHSFHKEGGVQDDSTVEQSFAVLENRLPELFEFVRNKRRPSVRVWETFFEFAALQRARSPIALHSIQKSTSELYSRMFDIMKTTPQFAEDMKAKGLDPEAVRNTEFKITANREHLLLSALTVYGSGNLTRLFSRMKWIFIVAPAGQYFWTSDDPVCCWADRDTSSAFHSMVGPANSDAEVTFPLSRRICAFAKWTEPSADLYNLASADQVKAINHRTVNNGWRYVYGPVNDGLIRGWVEKIAENRTK